MRPEIKRRIGGLLMIAIGLVLIWIIEDQGVHEGRFLLKGALFGPAALVLGVALLFIPGYREERQARGEDISLLHGTQLITPRWWGVLVIALAAGGLYTLALANGHTLLPH